MPLDDPQGIAWVWADAHLECETVRAAAAQIVAALTSTSPDDVRSLWAQAQGVPWTIQNAYYEASVAHYFDEKADATPNTPAVILLVHGGSPLSVHAKRASAHEGFDVPIALVVGLGEGPVAGEAAAPPTGDVDETYAVHGWEYMEVTEPDVMTRLRDALMVHRWPNAQLVAPDATPPGVHALAQLPDAQRPWPAAPHSMQQDLDAFLEEDDEFGAFTSAEPAKQEDCTPGDLFPDSLPKLMEHVKSLPPGPAREDAAARVAMAWERALALP